VPIFFFWKKSCFLRKKMVGYLGAMKGRQHDAVLLFAAVAA